MGHLEEHLTKKLTMNRMMQMSAIGSVDRNLRNEDLEMKDWNDRQNEILYGKNKSESVSLSEGEEDPMLVGGDHNVNHNHYYESEKKAEKPRPQPKSLPQVPTNSSNLKNNLLTAAALLGSLGGGVGIGTAINSEEKPPPSVESEEQPKEDLDTIGILEPDR